MRSRRALAWHPTNADVWIRAARWEFDGTHNVDAARMLLQRALRLNATSQGLRSTWGGAFDRERLISSEIWLFFFEMEVQKAMRLRQRKRLVLGRATDVSTLRRFALAYSIRQELPPLNKSGAVAEVKAEPKVRELQLS